MSRKRGGRPPRTSDPSIKTVGVRLSLKEYNDLRDQAQAAGLSLSEFIRARFFQTRIKARPLVPAINREIYAELARSASNLNQMAHHLNEGRVTSVPGQDVLQEIRSLYGHLKSIRLEMIGSR